MTTLALDLGSSEFRSIRQNGQRLVARKIPAVYCVLANDNSNKRLLEQTRIAFAETQDFFISMGQSACDLSNLIRCPLIPVVLDGHLPANDPIGRQVCVALVESLVPHAGAEHSLCVINWPASTARAVGERREFIENALSLRGFQTTTLNSGMALALAELQNSAFSGMAFVMGAESISVTLTHHGNSVFEGRYGQGFRSIEDRFAKLRHRYLWDQQGNQYLDVQGVKNWIRETELDLTTPHSGDELWIVKRLSQLMTDAWSSMLPDLMRVSEHALLRERIPVVVSGGPAHLDGFPLLLQHVMEKSCLPIRIQDIRLSSYGPYAVARGLLVHGSMLSSSRPAVA